jgi:hypothetical protein
MWARAGPQATGPERLRGGERTGNDIRQRALGGCLVVLVAVDQHRRQQPMPGEVPDLIEADAGFLAMLDRCRDARVTERVTPHVQSDPPPEHADDPQHAARLEPVNVAALMAAIRAELERQGPPTRWARVRRVLARGWEPRLPRPRTGVLGALTLVLYAATPRRSAFPTRNSHQASRAISYSRRFAQRPGARTIATSPTR